MHPATEKTRKQLDLHREDSLAYGAYKGFFMSLYDMPKAICISIDAFIDKEDGKNAFLLEMYRLQNEYQVYNINVDGPAFAFYLSKEKGLEQRLPAFIEAATALLLQYGAYGQTYCCICHGATYEDQSHFFAHDGAHLAHRQCAERFLEGQEGLEQPPVPEEPEAVSPPFVRAVAGATGALLGGLVGSIPWIIVGYMGLFVGFLGFVIGLAAKKGYELLGGAPGKAKRPIIIAAVILSVLLSSYFTSVIGVYSILAGQPGAVGSAFLITLSLYMDPSFLGEIAFDLILGLLFAMLGCRGMFRELKQEGSFIARQPGFIGQSKLPGK